MVLTDESQYSSDPYTRNFGADRIQMMLRERYGKRYDDYRAAWDKAGPDWVPEFPINLLFDLVDKCNLACPQCLRAPDLMKDFGGFIGTKKYLSKDTIKRILDECREHQLPSVNIAGSGECTLHPDFLEICEAVVAIDPCIPRRLAALSCDR